MNGVLEEVSMADIVVVIGTSMVVYPAAGLLNFVDENVPKYIIDPVIPEGLTHKNLTKIAKKAGEGVPELVKLLIRNH